MGDRLSKVDGHSYEWTRRVDGAPCMPREKRLGSKYFPKWRNTVWRDSWISTYLKASLNGTSENWFPLCSFLIADKWDDPIPTLSAYLSSLYCSWDELWFPLAVLSCLLLLLTWLTMVQPHWPSPSFLNTSCSVLIQVLFLGSLLLGIFVSSFCTY
jgi:hypothetical protein